MSPLLASLETLVETTIESIKSISIISLIIFLIIMSPLSPVSPPFLKILLNLHLELENPPKFCFFHFLWRLWCQWRHPPQCYRF